MNKSKNEKFNQKNRRLTLKKGFFALCLCFLSGCVSYNAEHYDKENNCWEAPVEVESEFGISGGRHGAQAYVEDDEGEIWLFSSTPIPEGYREVRSEKAFELALVEPCS